MNHKGTDSQTNKRQISATSCSAMHHRPVGGTPSSLFFQQNGKEALLCDNRRCLHGVAGKCHLLLGLCCTADHLPGYCNVVASPLLEH